jgi:hypothetical protein
MKGIFISLFLPCLKGGVKTVLGIKKKRGKMCRNLGNKNDGKIFKTLGIGEVENMTLEGRFSNGGNVKTFVAAFAVCFMNIWVISKPGTVLWLL